MEAILFAGLIYPETFDRLLEQTKDIPHKFASIWENEDPSYVQRLIDNNFTIVTSEVKLQELYLPQFVPVVEGIKRIKDKGYTHVLKTRFDVISPDYGKYMKLIKEAFTSKITVICGIQTCKNYFLQIMEYGHVDDMSRFYTLQPKEDTGIRYPEQFLMETYSGKRNLTKEDLNEIFNFSLPLCIEHKIDFIWYRPSHYWIAPNRSFPYMRVITEHCMEPTMWVNSSV
jgi:hypothetical protein